VRTRKDINQTIPGGQHLDPVQTLINANVSSCQEDFYHSFYCECFSKSSKKFDLNLLRVKPFEWKENIAGVQGIAAWRSTCFSCVWPGTSAARRAFGAKNVLIVVVCNPHPFYILDLLCCLAGFWTPPPVKPIVRQGGDGSQAMARGRRSPLCR
jgi:hypothetical protein